jgi:hypothetical protein
MMQAPIRMACGVVMGICPRQQIAHRWRRPLASECGAVPRRPCDLLTRGTAPCAPTCHNIAYAAFAEEFADPPPPGPEDHAPGLANKRSPSHAPTMFVVTEADAAAIRAAFEQRGELSAAIELRRLFPGITDNAQAQACARTIAGWKPLPLRPVKRVPKTPRLRRIC